MFTPTALRGMKAFDVLVKGVGPDVLKAEPDGEEAKKRGGGDARKFELKLEPMGWRADGSGDVTPGSLRRIARGCDSSEGLDENSGVNADVWIP